MSILLNQLVKNEQALWEWWSPALKIVQIEDFASGRLLCQHNFGERAQPGLKEKLMSFISDLLPRKFFIA
ncbi:MAG: hypothetical protein R2932_36155 [Caldilineaceae bacterium]